MGNPLLKNYNIEKDHFLTGGFNNLWKIYKGSRKDRKQDVCIFVLEKKVLDKYPKDERDEIVNSLKKEAGALVKFKHPSMLGIYEQVLEDKQTLIFVTEPVQHTLNSWLETSGASKLEIKLMITEICHVFNFLHDDAHVIHGSLNPENIFIDAQGHIKLSGLGFSMSDPSLNGIECKFNFSSPNSIPNLSYVAPEIVNDQMANYQSDIFSIGIIVYNILKKYKNEDRDKELINLYGSNTVSSYNKAYESINKILSRLSFEADDNEFLRRALNTTVQSRPKIKELLEDAWFNDPKVKALRFIENLENNDAAKVNEFLNKFPQIVSLFEPKIVDRRFLPALMNALKVETLIVAALPSIFCICESKTIKIDFEQAVWPGLKNLFNMKQLPAAGLFYILSKLNFLSEKISNSEFASNMLNIIGKALDCNVPKIQSVVMDNLSFVIKKVDSLAFKNQIYPRLISVLLNTNSFALKILVLKSFPTIYTLLDHTIINDSLLVNLEKVRKSDSTGEVCMCIANIYEEIAKIVSIEVS